jgi:pimeloyl-ACP methyl ester carboxylesterase
MSKVKSKDGTTIGYEQQGSGSPVIVVDGATGYRAFDSFGRLAELMAPRFTVIRYDRRGRGESGDTLPFAVAREIEDIDALIQVAGGSAYLFGISSGACLCLEATLALGAQVKKLAMYEPPYDAEPVAQAQWREYRRNLSEALAAGNRGEAVTLFMKLVGVPAEQIEGMRQSPMWPGMEGIAPTLAYDAAAMGESRGAPLERARSVTVPALVMDGGANLEMMPFMRATAAALAQAMPRGQQQTLPGQTHDVSMDVLAPVLVEFFAG